MTLELLAERDIYKENCEKYQKTCEIYEKAFKQIKQEIKQIPCALVNKCGVLEVLDKYIKE